jgi:hypothetical protein
VAALRRFAESAPSKGADSPNKHCFVALSLLFVCSPCVGAAQIRYDLANASVNLISVLWNDIFNISWLSRATALFWPVLEGSVALGFHWHSWRCLDKTVRSPMARFQEYPAQSSRPTVADCRVTPLDRFCKADKFPSQSGFRQHWIRRGGVRPVRFETVTTAEANRSSIHAQIGALIDRFVS